MPSEGGGRADKLGNRYEKDWIIKELIKVCSEEIDSIIIEPIGNDEKGVDIWSIHKDGTRIAQQCKVRNASKEYWDVSSLKSKRIIENSLIQLSRSPLHKFALVSPIVCTMLEDLTYRARNTNGNHQDFLNFQIQDGSGKEFIRFFHSYSKALELDWTIETELIKLIDILSRTYYYQYPDTVVQKQELLNSIKFHFINDSSDVYDALESFIINENIFGKEIDKYVISKYLESRNIIIRIQMNEKLVMPRFEILNSEFSDFFNKITNKLFDRKESQKCIEAIDNNESIIIHGKAGAGKSGCTHSIINYCNESSIPYLAIKLDKRIPRGNAFKFGDDLGLPDSIVHCLDSVSSKKKCVLVLDQLDVLRWTQGHSREALDVCSEILSDIKRLNNIGKTNIIVVLVCRTYDYVNDNNIKQLLNSSGDDSMTEWKEIVVGELDDDVLVEVLGERFTRISEKLKKMLKVPLNLFIWDKLDDNLKKNEFKTTNQLIEQWWNQLLSTSQINGIDEQELLTLKNKIVYQIDRTNNGVVNLRLLGGTTNPLKYLISNGMLTSVGDKVTFSHQSMQDYFLVENMSCSFFKGESVSSLVGERNVQTPTKRYQLQMLLQYIQEYDFDLFIEAGKELLNNSNIRFYMKFVFFEILGQLEELTDSMKELILEMIVDPKYKKHFIETVIKRNNIYCDFLIESGVFESWLNEGNTIQLFDVLMSVRDNPSELIRAFIKSKSFMTDEIDLQLMNCFSFKISNEHDDMFKLRMEFYRKYPNFIDSFIDFKDLFLNAELRAIELIELFLELNNNKHGNKVYRNEEKLWEEFPERVTVHGKDIYTKLIPYVPLDDDKLKISFSEWSGRYTLRSGIERACIEIIKKAVASISKNDPNWLYDQFKEFENKDSPLINEILLTALKHMPITESNQVIDYICLNINKRIIDKTSGLEDHLSLIKDVISIHSVECSEELYKRLETGIYNYKEINQVEQLKHRIEFNKTNTYGERVYWHYWGEVQDQLLRCLPVNRQSQYTVDLLKVFDRRYLQHNRTHTHNLSRSGSVSSPISGIENKISNKQWKKIILNKELKERHSSKWNDSKSGFIDSSIESFSRSFGAAVRNEPIRFIKLVLELGSSINEVYVNSLFSALAYSVDNKVKQPSAELYNELLLSTSIDKESSLANSFCRIIEINGGLGWDIMILDKLKNIAVNHSNPTDSPNVYNKDDAEMKTLNMLESNAINCTRGNAASAIASILWENENMFEDFKTTIKHLSKDVNPAVRLASIDCLCPSYNFDKEWASKIILDVFNEDYRTIGGHSSGRLIFLLYHDYRDDILKLIMKACFSEDDDLKKKGIFLLAKMHIVYDEFTDIVDSFISTNAEQVKWIAEMSIIYFDRKDYRVKVKSLLERMLECDLELDFPYSRLFYDKKLIIDDDRDFIKKIMASKHNKRVMYSFKDYLKESTSGIIYFGDIIFGMINSILLNQNDEDRMYDIDGQVTKLIFSIYDESLNGSGNEEIKMKCLDMWDAMFENSLGSIRSLSRELLER